MEEKDNLITVLQTKVVWKNYPDFWISVITVRDTQVKLLASPMSSASDGTLIDFNNAESSRKSSDETDKDSKEGHITEGEVQQLKGNFSHYK